MKTGTTLHYMTGFGNHFATEAKPETLPKSCNSPQKVASGLYAEQLTGSAFTAHREENFRSWLYRVQPSVVQGEHRPFSHGRLRSAPDKDSELTPNPLRWNPLPNPSEPTDFIEGLQTWATNGSAEAQTGCAVHLYAANRSQDGRFVSNADGELLIVPQEGLIRIDTEMGSLEASPWEIAVIPRGLKFRVMVPEKIARGYICENYGRPFRLPYLGPIGANGLANPRDFETPVARFESLKGHFELITKFDGKLWTSNLDHSPLDVIAWHGNYAPYKYDLKKFNVINTVSFDHPDPSIFTVLTSPSELTGTANADFVIFPPRWMVGENTFRPPYYHRNIMSEFMGLIDGVYDARQEGFVPGGASLHNQMTPHGPDATTFDKASNAELSPHKIERTLAFMFESRYPFRPTEWSMKCGLLQRDYLACWQGLTARCAL